MTYTSNIKANKRNSSNSADALYWKNLLDLRARYSADLDVVLHNNSNDAVLSKKIRLIIALLHAKRSSLPTFPHRFVMLRAVEQQIAKWQKENL
mmetsp:Transcript_18177/g.23010  ORF Transcript_18177/g.23010 Transcript_18177/m.23010 type:complete len:94 (-) Transcript_18177:62-343(-)